MIRLVIDQRNITPEQLSYYRGMHYLADKRAGGRPEVRMHEENKLAQVEQVYLDGSTATRLADEYDVSSATIRRDGVSLHHGLHTLYAFFGQTERSV